VGQARRIYQNLGGVENHYNAAHDACKRKLLAAPDVSQFGSDNSVTHQQQEISAGGRIGFSDNAPPSEDFEEQFNRYMDKLANAAINEKAVMERLSTSIANLTKANSKLVSSNIKLSATNAKLTFDLCILRKQLNAAAPTLSPTHATALMARSLVPTASVTAHDAPKTTTAKCAAATPIITKRALTGPTP